MYGDAMLHFRHNFRHSLNVIDWLCESSKVDDVGTLSLRSLLLFTFFNLLNSVGLTLQWEQEWE